MPTVLKMGKFRFFFFSNEGTEPPHIHIESAGKYAKFWLDFVELAESQGYNKTEINRLSKLVEQHRDDLKSKWHEYFNQA